MSSSQEPATYNVHILLKFPCSTLKKSIFGGKTIHPNLQTNSTWWNTSLVFSRWMAQVLPQSQCPHLHNVLTVLSSCPPHWPPLRWVALWRSLSQGSVCDGSLSQRNEYGNAGATPENNPCSFVWKKGVEMKPIWTMGQKCKPNYAVVQSKRVLV